MNEQDPLTLLDIPSATLEARQSRSHRFEVPDSDAVRILELTVTIVFQVSQPASQSVRLQ